MEQFKTKIIKDIYEAVAIEYDGTGYNNIDYKEECRKKYINCPITYIMSYNEDDILTDILSSLNRVEDNPDIKSRTEICMQCLILLCEIVEKRIDNNKKSKLYTKNKLFKEYMDILTGKIFDIGIVLYHMIRTLDNKVDSLTRDSGLINMLSHVFSVSCVDILKECSTLGARVPTPDLSMAEYNNMIQEWIEESIKAIKVTDEDEYEYSYNRAKALEYDINANSTAAVFLGDDTDTIYDKVRHYCYLNNIDMCNISISYVNCVDENAFFNSIIEKSKSKYVKDILSIDMSDYGRVSSGKLKVSSLINNIIMDIIDISTVLYNAEFEYVSALDDLEVS